VLQRQSAHAKEHVTLVLLAELQPVVAAHARIGRPPGVIFADEVVDDPGEILFEIEDVERDSQLPGNAACVGGV
jgi:hypothetical protein